MKDQLDIEPEHDTSDDWKIGKGCWCNPKMEYIEESDSWLIVHNSLDGREKRERNEKAN